MRISEKIAQAEREDRVWWSFEYFPPRTAQVSPTRYLHVIASHVAFRAFKTYSTA
jgi:5,10-methylenetetrahydrofolate reductase